MADRHVTLQTPAADLMRSLIAQRDGTRQAAQQAEANYHAILNALAGEHGMTDPGTLEITADAVTLVMPVAEQAVPDGI